MQGLRLAGIVLTIIFAGCQNTGGTEDLSSLKKIKGKEVRHNLSNTKKFREQAIEETAVSIGAQSGLAYQTKQNNMVLNKHAKALDRIFNFQHMLLQENVLCPVLIESSGSFSLDPNGDALRIADRTFLIHKQARFVTTAPNWRNYLWMEYSAPDKPDNALLPITRSERTAWAEGVTKGWQHGIKQAQAMFKNNLHKLTQDYQGMILYKSLLAQNMVSMPHVGVVSLGVTGDENEIRVNDQILRITALPVMDIDSSDWKPLITR